MNRPAMQPSKPASVVVCLLLSACATPAQWRQNPLADDDIIRIEHDHVSALGQVRQDSSELKSGSLVLMGKKYWYVFDTPSSEAALTVLKPGLTDRYLIQRRPWHAHRHADAADNLIELDIEWDKNRHGQAFRTKACLRYQLSADSADTAQHERNTLSEAGFTPITGLTDAYARCLPLQGHYYRKPKNAAAVHSFPHSLPVLLRIHTGGSGPFNFGNLTKNMLMTPFTLTADVVGTVFVFSKELFD